MRARITRAIILGTAFLAACAVSPGFVEDRRTSDSIQAAFDRSKHDIYRVYAEALKRNPDLIGRAIYRITVNADGQVVDSVVVESSLPDAEVPLAIKQIISGMNFGRVRHPGYVRFDYPMDFIPRK